MIGNILQPGTPFNFDLTPNIDNIFKEFNPNSNGSGGIDLNPFNN
jgi:hypothetical protein